MSEIRVCSQKSSSYLGAMWKKAIASTRLIMQVKPGADFLTHRSEATGGSTPNNRRKKKQQKKKAARLLRRFALGRQEVGCLPWKDNCTWRKSSHRNELSFIWNHLPVSAMGWIWEVAGSQRGLSLQKGRRSAITGRSCSRHSVPAPSPTQRVKHVGLLLSERNWSDDLSAHGEVEGLREAPGCHLTRRRRRRSSTHQKVSDPPSRE